MDKFTILHEALIEAMNATSYMEMPSVNLYDLLRYIDELRKVIDIREKYLTHILGEGRELPHFPAVFDAEE